MIKRSQTEAGSLLSGQPSLVFVLAAWFGVMTGWAEVLILVVQKFVFGKYVHESLDVVWMAPLTNVFFLMLPALGLYVGVRFLPRWVSLRVVTFAFAWLAFFSLALLFQWLDHGAAVVLAAGLAFQTARSVGAHAHGFYALMRRTLGWVKLPRPAPAAPAAAPTPPLSRREFLVTTGASLVALAAGVRGWQWLNETRALSALPPPPAQPPNVLLIVLDTVRAESMSLYGYARATTPQLARLVENGVLFENAVATAPWTLPSHASMFTGRYPHEMNADLWTPLDATYPTLAEALSARGYLTAGFIANTDFCTRESGLARGFVHYEDYPTSAGQAVLSAALGQYVSDSPRLRRAVDYYDALNRKRADEINASFLNWLGASPRQPFFVFLNYYDAHEPYIPPAPFDTLFAANPPRRKFLQQYWGAQVTRGEREAETAQDRQERVDAYDAALAYLDHHVGLLFEELKRRGALENTLVLVVSDHGEQLGEHGLFTHGNSLYRQLLQVPLFVLFPGRAPAGTRVRAPITLRDLPATVLDLVGAAAGGDARFPGNSLARFWKGAAVTAAPLSAPLLAEVKRAPINPEWYPVVKGDMQALVAEGWHYIRNGDGREELYDYENDPAESRDVSETEEGRRASERLRAVLAELLKKN